MLKGEYAGYLKEDPQRIVEALRLADEVILAVERGARIARTHPQYIELSIGYADLISKSNSKVARRRYQQAQKYLRARGASSSDSRMRQIDEKIRNLETLQSP